jgi:hypothetical protein
MAKPTLGSRAKLKRLARYLLSYPRLVWRFTGERRDDEEVLDVFSDSDWAGDRRTRKSTSGGVAVLSGGTVKSWSSTQGTIAMSVGEAEYYAMVKAAAEALGMQSLARDLGYDLRVRLWVDSTTAQAIVARLGLGKVRHMEVKYLWAQEAYRAGRFDVQKVKGEENPADINTKPKSGGEMSVQLGAIGGCLIKRSTEEGPWEKLVGGPKVSWADAWEQEEDDEEG